MTTNLQNVPEDSVGNKLISIYSFITTFGIIIGIIFIPYFLLLKFNFLFVLVGLVYFIFGVGSTFYLENIIKKLRKNE